MYKPKHWVKNVIKIWVCPYLTQRWVETTQQFLVLLLEAKLLCEVTICVFLPVKPSVRSRFHYNHCNLHDLVFLLEFDLPKTGLNRLSNSSICSFSTESLKLPAHLIARSHTPKYTRCTLFRWWNPGQFSWAWIWALSGKLMQRDLENAAWRWGDQTQPLFSLSTIERERERETCIKKNRP